MYTKRIFKNQNRQQQNPSWIASVVSNSMLFIGALLLVSSLLFLLFNLNKSDSLVIILLPLVVMGICLMVVSQFFQSSRRKLRHSSGHPMVKSHKI
jgi:uncharacterized membrane-anchored protein